MKLFLITEQGPVYPTAVSWKSEIFDDFSFAFDLGEVKLTLVSFVEGKVTEVCESEGGDRKSKEEEKTRMV